MEQEYTGKFRGQLGGGGPCVQVGSLDCGSPGEELGQQGELAEDWLISTIQQLLGW